MVTVRRTSEAEDEEFGDVPLFLVREPHWDKYHEKQAALSFDNFLRSREPNYQRAAQTALKLEFEQYIAAVKGVVPEVRSAKQAEDVDEETEEEINNALVAAGVTGAGFWTSRFIREHEQTLRVLLARLRGQIDVGLVVSDDIIQNIIQERVEFLANEVTATNIDAVLHEVLVGVSRGETMDQIVGRIQNIRRSGLFVFEEDISVPEQNRRTRLIAAQESSYIVNRGALAAAQESDEDLRKQWISQRDSRVRPLHAAQDNGNLIPLNQAFDLVGVLAPPHSFGCRCFLGFERVDD